MTQEIHFILYVKNQQRSTVFYAELLKMDPILDVPGMSEFQLSEYCKLGIMPEQGIANIITPKMPHPELGNGFPSLRTLFKSRQCRNLLQSCVNAWR